MLLFFLHLENAKIISFKIDAEAHFQSYTD